jgi:hypothetical protein
MLDVTYKKTKFIEIYDDAFSHQELKEIFFLINERSYLQCNLDDQLNNNLFVNKKWSSEISENEKLYHILMQKYYCLLNLQNKKFRIIRHYVNCADSGTVDLIHEDAAWDSENFFTIIQYGNFKWNPNWHGETVFYNQNYDEIIEAVSIKPGRIIVFDSKIPHSARTSSRIAEFSRFTIVTKIQILN